MESLANSVCSAVENYFTLPNFCSCKRSSFGGKLECQVGIGGAKIGASAWFEPCGSPASFGYEAYASVYGAGYGSIKKWTARFLFTQMIPYASVKLGFAEGGARAELAGVVNGGRIEATFGIGFCAANTGSVLLVPASEASGGCAGVAHTLSRPRVRTAGHRTSSRAHLHRRP